MNNFFLNANSKIDVFITTVKYLFYAFFIFIEIDVDIFNIVTSLICIDLVTGVIKSLTIPTMSFSFKDMYKGLLSKLILILVPITLALAAKAFGGDLVWFVNTVLKVVILSEVISILTNFLSIRKGEEVVNKDYIVILVDNIIQFIDDKIEKYFNNFK